MISLKFNEMCDKLKDETVLFRVLNIIGLTIDKSKYEETYIFSNNLDQYLCCDADLEDLTFYFIDDSCLYKATYNTNEKCVNINKKYLNHIVSVDLKHKLSGKKVELSITFVNECDNINISNLEKDVKGEWLSKEFSDELYNAIIDIYSKI